MTHRCAGTRQPATAPARPGAGRTPEMPTTTTTPATDHRRKGRPIGTYRTASGAERRLLRQQARDGQSPADGPAAGRGRRYLVERGLNEGELEALAADFLAE